MKKGAHFVIKRAAIPGVENCAEVIIRSDGFITAAQFAKIVGAHQMHVTKEIRDGRFKPDHVNARGRYLFHHTKINEHIASWNSRHAAFPTSAREMAVITPSGMIRPRAAPDVRALAPLLLAKLRPTSRPGYLTRNRDYNLKDLQSSPSRPPSTHIFASTSLKSVQIKPAKKTRRTT